ncbi:hypothetical protein ACJDU8_08985 [Clostridium sp. WILCCON 0269]|uniref:Uncharacterized protein n=1 Tax=Candidatus Clostridium eludens TaxID=3381663 RepID=A0ABW8SI47_9CLOT
MSIVNDNINKTIDWVKEELGKIDADDWYIWVILSKEKEYLLGTEIIYVEEEYEKFEICINIEK